LTTVTPDSARITFRILEPVHGMIYFSPHGPAAYAEVGLADRQMMYFASRAAALGPASAEVVIATFFNFSPTAIRAALPAAWSIATPAQVLAARLAAVDRSLRQAWGDDITSPQVREAADLARRAAERACDRLEGRPLFAAHAALPWPDEPHLVLWHAQTLLREYRGDGHVALLLTGGMNGLDALITHSAAGFLPPKVFRASRGWTEEEWAAGVERLQTRGWLAAGPDLALSAEGRRHRDAIEVETDRMAVYPYEAIGEDGCARLRETATPLRTRVIEGDLGFPSRLAAQYQQ
jgi:hypothetical protein